MTDILIKGMEMPKDEYVDVRIFKDGRVIANQADANEPNSHYATFTAIAVPPYGRLIDAVKLAEEFDGHGIYMEEEVKKIIDFFPTILEANND